LIFFFENSKADKIAITKSKWEFWETIKLDFLDTIKKCFIAILLVGECVDKL